MYAPAEFVYDIAQLVHQQQLAPLRIVAHSLGGNVALRYAGTYPEHVERLVVIEGWGGIVPGHVSGHPRRSGCAAWIETQRSLAARQPRRYATLDDAYRADAGGQPAPVGGAGPPPHHPRRQPERGRHVHVEVRQLHPHQPGPRPAADDVRELWRNIACPVLLITGSESWIRSGGDPARLVERVRRRPPRRRRRSRPLGPARPARRVPRAGRGLPGLALTAITTRSTRRPAWPAPRSATPTPGDAPRRREPAIQESREHCSVAGLSVKYGRLWAPAQRSNIRRDRHVVKPDPSIARASSRTGPCGGDRPPELGPTRLTHS